MCSDLFCDTWGGSSSHAILIGLEFGPGAQTIFAQIVSAWISTRSYYLHLVNETTGILLQQSSHGIHTDTIHLFLQIISRIIDGGIMLWRENPCHVKKPRPQTDARQSHAYKQVANEATPWDIHKWFSYSYAYHTYDECGVWDQDGNKIVYITRISDDTRTCTLYIGPHTAVGWNIGG